MQTARGSGAKVRRHTAARSRSNRRRARHSDPDHLFGLVFFFQAEDGIRDDLVTGVQTCALPIYVAGFSRVDQPGYIMRLVPGSNPSETALTEVYLPPEIAYGSRGIDLDTKGVV